MDNTNIAHIFYQISEYLAMEEIPFKPRAYEKVARTIESLEEPVEQIYKSAGLKGLKEIPGVGISIAETIEEKRRIIDEIYRSYLERDIIAFLRVEKGESFTNLVKVLARRVGNLTNIAELSSSLCLSYPTIQNYLWYLQKTYILRKTAPYFKNIRKEIIKTPVFYFSDLGLRNYAAGEWGRAIEANDAGFIFENFIHLMLYEKVAYSPRDLRFWRSKDGAEVDFIIVEGEKLIPLEVKFKKLRSGEIGRSLKNFIKKYKPEPA